MYVYIYIYIYIHMCVHIYIYIYVYIHRYYSIERQAMHKQDKKAYQDEKLEIYHGQMHDRPLCYHVLYYY